MYEDSEIVVSKFARPGRISHEYTDHVLILKFIERNLKQKRLTDRSRYNLPNPNTSHDDPYVALNGPGLEI